MIAKTGPGEYKLFNLIHLNYYDQLREDISSPFEHFLEPGKIKVGPQTDAWSLGVFMAMLYKPHTAELKTIRYSYEYFQMIC